MRFMIAAILAVLASASTLAAQEMKPETESPAKVALDLLKKYDANNDGAISKSECSSGELFKKYDGDLDGRITAQEIRNQEQALRRKAEVEMPKRKASFRGLDDFGDHDLNADGRFSKKELESFAHDAADQNRDGFLTEEEYKYIDTRPGGEEKSVDLESFDKLDENKDKKLSESELQLSKEYVDALDRNNDGFVSKEELIEATIRKWGGVPGASPEAVLKRLDANGDGELDRKEFDGKQRLWDEMNSYRPMKEDPTVSRDEIERYLTRVRDLRMKANSFMTRYDLNGDGKVTRDEYDGPDGAFARCDANGDGLITRADGIE